LKNDIASGLEASSSWFSTSGSIATKTYANLTSSFEAEKYFTDNSGSLKTFATSEANAKVTELVINSSSLWDKGLEASSSWFSTSGSIATKTYATAEANAKVTELVTNSSSLWDSGSIVYEAINTGKDLAGNNLYTTDNKPI
jgi:vacuolar-type H+-ATPase subunit C/Vma6